MQLILQAGHPTIETGAVHAFLPSCGSPFSNWFVFSHLTGRGCTKSCSNFICTLCVWWYYWEPALSYTSMLNLGSSVVLWRREGDWAIGEELYVQGKLGGEGEAESWCKVYKWINRWEKLKKNGSHKAKERSISSFGFGDTKKHNYSLPSIRSVSCLEITDGIDTWHERQKVELWKVSFCNFAS